jgi:hypothetical protein
VILCRNVHLDSIDFNGTGTRNLHQGVYDLSQW